MARRDKDTQAVVAPEKPPNPLVLDWPFDEAKIDAESEQIGHHVLGVLEREPQMTARMAPLKLGQQPGHQVIAHGEAGRQVQVKRLHRIATPGLDLTHAFERVDGLG